MMPKFRFYLFFAAAWYLTPETLGASLPRGTSAANASSNATSGPVVKLRQGTVKGVNSSDNSQELFLGDLNFLCLEVDKSCPALKRLCISTLSQAFPTLNLLSVSYVSAHPGQFPRTSPPSSKPARLAQAAFKHQAWIRANTPKTA